MYLIVVNDEKGALVCEMALTHQLSIGRTTENDIVLPSTAVSRRHAVIMLQGTQVVIEDQGSANGVFIDDEPISGPHPFYEGSQVRIGTYRLFLEKQKEFDAERGGFHTAVVHPNQAHAKILITSGAHVGKEFLLFDPISRVGRTQENDVTIPHPSISREHAQLKRQDNGSYILSDMGSSNGTIVRGKKIHKAVTVYHGDMIQFGQVECMLLDPKGQSKKRSSGDLNKAIMVLIAIIVFAILGGLLAK
jgi:pSer/pThr/pTyr-binding forkhead associated (FHA) protein